MFGDGLDGHVRQQLEGVAFEGMGEAAKGPGEADGRLADETALTAAQALHGQSQLDGLTADGQSAENAFFGPMSDDVRRLAMGTTVVLGILAKMKRHHAEKPRLSPDEGYDHKVLRKMALRSKAGSLVRFSNLWYSDCGANLGLTFSL